jgi:hypothetical protein
MTECEHCGEVIESPRIRGQRRQRFCSPACYRESIRRTDWAECERCGSDFLSKYNRFCSWDCYIGGSWSKAAGRVEDVEFLMQAGEAPEQIMSRLGTSSGTLARYLARHERPDLARPFWRLRDAERRAA